LGKNRIQESEAREQNSEVRSQKPEDKAETTFTDFLFFPFFWLLTPEF
jgi:hypothetical protein